MRYNVKTDGTKRNKRFERFCVLNQEDIKMKLKKELKGMGKEVIDDDGFLYAKGSIPIILTAHMDTVHKELPKEIIYEKGKISSPQGIGGDDRCGIYMIMEIIKEFPCHVLFFEDEEVGGIGSEKFINHPLCMELANANIKYCIDLDRMNANDAVYYYCSNPDFEDFIESEFWKYGHGSFTDIVTICPELGCAGVNLSCGYYKQHTTSEYVVLSEMETAIKEVKKLIARSKEVEVFEYIEKYTPYSTYSNYSSGKYGYYDYWEDDDYGYYGNVERKYIITYAVPYGTEKETVWAKSETEAVGQFLISHADLTYNHIVEIG